MTPVGKLAILLIFLLLGAYANHQAEKQIKERKVQSIGKGVAPVQQ